MNAFFLSTFEKGREKEGTEKLSDIWRNMKSSDVYEEASTRQILGRLVKLQSGIFDNSAMKTTILNHFDESTTL